MHQLYKFQLRMLWIWQVDNTIWYEIQHFLDTYFGTIRSSSTFSMKKRQHS